MKLTNHQVADRTATVGPDTLRFPAPRPPRLRSALGPRNPVSAGWVVVTDLVADDAGLLYVPVDAVLQARPSTESDVHVTVNPDDTVSVISPVPLTAVSLVTDPAVAYAPVTDLIAPALPGRRKSAV